MKKNKMQVLVVDDHPIFRKGLINVLNKTNRLTKTFEASNGKEAIEMIANHPDIEVIFMDINMPLINGIEATKTILAKNPSKKVIVNTMSCDQKHIHQMIESNVSGYILKDGKMTEITKALDLVLDNQTYFSPKVQELILHGYQDLINGKKTPKKSDGFIITKSQKQVLKLLCKQYSNTEIANELKVSELTVRRHRQDLLERTNSKNLVGLIIYAIENNIHYLM